MTDRKEIFANDAYRLLIEGVVDYAIYMLDPHGTVVSWNPGAERIKGYSADEIIGEHFSRFYVDADRVAGVPEAALRQAAETGRFTTEAWRVRKDGTRFWAMVVIDVLRQNGELVGFAKVTRDLTEQRAAQLERLESERRFRLLVQGVTDYAIYMLSPEGMVTNWNAGAERIKGYGSTEIVGLHFSRFYTPEDRNLGVPVKALAVARREGRYEAEGWRLRKDGSRFWAGVVIEAIHDEGEFIGFAKITRDLTERREAQRQLEQSREELFQAQKMEAVGQLTGGLAHDLNNLLTGVSGSMELLRKRLAQGRVGDADRYITAAEDATRRAANLTQRLLAFSRRQTLDPKPTDVNRLIAGMEDLIRRTIGPGVTLEVVGAGGLWLTHIDQSQLENALLNLSINARDAMPDGGRITIETANKWLDDRAAGMRDVKPGQYVSVCVTDCGTGMTREVISRAFDPFYTTKPTGQGTGLGLSMVHGFVRQSGGQIRVYSEVGVGTTMCLYLPRFVGSLDSAEITDTTHSTESGQGEMVLVVDDEPTVRMLMVEVLEEAGYRTLAEGDGPAGLKILQSGVPLDLLITDVGLPGGINGRQLADAARVARPSLKVLFVTGYAENAAIGNGLLDAGMQVITKPFEMAALAEKVRKMIDT
jgi:PAS domain S-box-containing protein